MRERYIHSFMSLKSKIESLLFISNYPLSLKRLAEFTGESSGHIERALEDLKKEYDEKEDSGIILTKIGDKVQMATSHQNSKEVQEFIKDETTGDLTRPSLETLTIIAYRGPVSRAEIEQIRGVNCSIILRNLLMRGLIEASEDKKKMQTVYNISFDFLRFLGLSDQKELPNYNELNSAGNLQKVLEERMHEEE